VPALPEQGNLRYRSPVDARGYTMLMNCVLYDTQISDGAKVTYMVLLDHARQDDACYPGQDKLAEERGLTSRSVRSHLAELENRGLITIEQRGLNQTNLYWIEDLLTAYKPDVDRDRKKTSTPGRKNSSGQERKERSGQDRQFSSAKEAAERIRPRSNKTTAADSLFDVGVVPPMGSAADPSLTQQLVTAGLNRADAERLAASSPEECRRQLGFLPFVTEFRSGPGAYLRAAIEQGFAPPPAFLAAEKAKTREENRARRAAAAQADTDNLQAEKAVRAAMLEAEKERLQQDEPEQWAQIAREAEAMLPQPLKTRPDHVGYRPALAANIDRVLMARWNLSTF
jgi:hypothetical protein